MRPRVLVVLGAVALIPSAARAFCRTGTCNLPASFSPSLDKCVPDGFDHCLLNDGTTIKNIPLWWRSSCVGYSMFSGASRHVSLDDASQAMVHAFTAWTSRTCPSADGTTSGAVSIDVRDLGPVQCDEVGQGTEHQHVIVFRDETWPHKTADEVKNNLPSQTIALTTVSFDHRTGEIFDADMELNTADHTIVPTETPGNGVYDLQSVMTHEAGHFLGLAHSADSQAVMFYKDEGGSARHRALSADDVAGICAAYPAGGRRAVDTQTDPSGFVAATACDPTPRGGLSVTCVAPPAAATGGCAAARAPREGTRAWGALAGLALVGALRRVTARARRAPTSAPRRSG